MKVTPHLIISIEFLNRTFRITSTKIKKQKQTLANELMEVLSKRILYVIDEL
jgi:5-carboxymethyl-2-hydroxymuconate isomerase